MTYRYTCIYTVWRITLDVAPLANVLEDVECPSGWMSRHNIHLTVKYSTFQSRLQNRVIDNDVSLFSWLVSCDVRLYDNNDQVIIVFAISLSTMVFFTLKNSAGKLRALYYNIL